MQHSAFSRVAVVCLLTCAFWVAPVRAQLATQHIKGVVGLKAGSQPPPHWYVTVPILYLYATDTVKDRDGNRIGTGDADLTSNALAFGVTKVTTKKVLGGLYGFQFSFRSGRTIALDGCRFPPRPPPLL
jgi:hypothetical protein